ncbi:hypothetical protein MVEN_00685200 [Mycena venus]|uniref:DUF6532 domain-containing protein n=1 Tax=Mycena venus TaxID=2733690 RepID=A0A8H6YJV7_9AGAR|nr:hypothetical protein MVEN_00685200 [Mycena venus]
MSSINFAAQETPTYGRQHRQPMPTARIETHNQMQAEKENRRLAKVARKSAGHGATPAAARPQPRPLNFSRAPQNLAPAAIAASSIHAPAHSMAHPSLMQPHVDGFSHPETPHMVSVPTQRLHISAPGDDAAAHALAQLPQELEPRGLTQDINGLSAEERAELEQDPDADQPNLGSDSEDDEYHGRHAVNADQGFNAASPPVDTQITSTPVDLVLARKPTRRMVNHSSSPAVSTPAPTLAYHTPAPTIPYSTTPRGLVRRTHATHPFIPATNSPDPRSSPTPVPSKRAISEVDGARDERDEEHYSDADDEDGVTVLRASDLPPVRRRIFDTAARHMRLGVVSEAPYGDTIQMHQLGVASWFASQKELRETHGYEGVAQPTQDELALLKARRHQVKGDIKTIAREVADGKKGYGFKDGKSPEDIAYNRQLITTLLTGNAFPFQRSHESRHPGNALRAPCPSRNPQSRLL